MIQRPRNSTVRQDNHTLKNKVETRPRSHSNNDYKDMKSQLTINLGSTTQAYSSERKYGKSPQTSKHVLNIRSLNDERYKKKLKKRRSYNDMSIFYSSVCQISSTDSLSKRKQMEAEKEEINKSNFHTEPSNKNDNISQNLMNLTANLENVKQLLKKQVPTYTPRGVQPIQKILRSLSPANHKAVEKVSKSTYQNLIGATQENLKAEEQT